MLRLIRKNKENKISTETTEALILPIHSSNRSLDYLIELIKKIRPSDPDGFGEAELKFRAMLFQLSEDKLLVASLRKALLSQFVHSHLVEALSENGILGSRSFLPEFISRLKHKFLPPLYQTDDFLYVINRVFYKKQDYIWVTGIDQDLWVKLFQLLGVHISLTEPQIRWQLQQAMQILSYRIAASGLEKEISHRYEMLEDTIQPFLDQNHWVNELLSGTSTHTDEVIYSNIEETLHNCRQSIQWIRLQRKEYGTSLAQTYLVTRLRQQIERMFIILDVLKVKNKYNKTRLLKYFTTVVRNENTKNSLGSFISDNLGLLAYQIAEHKGRVDEQYFTPTRKDVKRLFRRSLGGGIFIAFIMIFRNLLGLLRMAPFWQGFVYSTNYAFGFLLMDSANATLAATQPAYTSSSIASSEDMGRHSKNELNNLAITVSKACRTQLASIAGNLLMVFPVTYGVAWLYFIITGIKIATGSAASKLLEDQHPWHSPALIYAFFTGIAIFLSGLIAGYVENHVVFGAVETRLQQHPVLIQTMARKRLNRIARFVTKNSGMLAGSIALGFFFGFATPLGASLGIPFDFRHITLSAGNAAIGFFGIDHHLSAGYISTILSGILLIGLVNFAVSFSLAFIVALKSRGIHRQDYPKMFVALWKYFIRHPANFIRPPVSQMINKER